MKYFYNINEDWWGPFTSAEVVEMFGNGDLKKDDWLCDEEENWIEVSSLIKPVRSRSVTKTKSIDQSKNSNELPVDSLSKEIEFKDLFKTFKNQILKFKGKYNLVQYISFSFFCLFVFTINIKWHQKDYYGGYSVYEYFDSLGKLSEALLSGVFKSKENEYYSGCGFLMKSSAEIIDMLGSSKGQSKASVDSVVLIEGAILYLIIFILQVLVVLNAVVRKDGFRAVCYSILLIVAFSRSYNAELYVYTLSIILSCFQFVFLFIVYFKHVFRTLFKCVLFLFKAFKYIKNPRVVLRVFDYR